MKPVSRFGVSAAVTLWLVGTTFAQAKSHEIDFNFVPAKTTINFTLGDVLHTVHGSFNAKNGVIHFDPATNK